MTKRFDNLESELSAYLDGELDDARRAKVERYLAENAEARALLDELRQTVGLVRGLERQSAPTDLAEDLLGRMERRSLLGEGQEFLTPEPQSSLGRYLATAAVVFLTFGVGMLIFQKEFTTSEQPDGTRTMAARDTAEQEADHLASPEAMVSRLEKQKEASEPKTAPEEIERVADKSQVARTKMQRADDVKTGQTKETVAQSDAEEDTVPQRDEMRVAMNRPTPPAPPRPEVAMKVPHADRTAEPTVGQSTQPMGENVEKAAALTQSFAGNNFAPSQPATAPSKTPSAAEVQSPTHAQPPEPRHVFHVLYEDAATQREGAETTWVYLTSNNIEILSVTENKPLRQLAEEHEASEDLEAALANAESQYLVRCTPDQIQALERFFRTDTGALNVTMEFQDAGVAGGVASSADVEEQTVERFSQKNEGAIQQAEAVERRETDSPAVTGGRKTSRPMSSLSVAPARKPISNRALQIDSAASGDDDDAEDKYRYTDASSPEPPMTQPTSPADPSRIRVGRYDSDRAATSPVGGVTVPTTRQTPGLRAASQSAHEESKKAATQRVTVLIRLQQRVAGAANQPAHIIPQTTRPTDSQP